MWKYLQIIRQWLVITIWPPILIRRIQVLFKMTKRCLHLVMETFYLDAIPILGYFFSIHIM